MKLRLWPRRREPEPALDEPTIQEPPRPPEPEPAPRIVPPRAPASLPPRPHALVEPEAPDAAAAEELPAKLSLTLEEAKAAIREAKGDVIQLGFLAGTYERQRGEDPRSAETAAARRRLCDLVATRLRDRKLLAPEGTFELREEAEAPKRS